MLHEEVLCKEVYDFLNNGDIDPKQTVTAWGGWTIGNCAVASGISAGPGD